MSERLQSPTRLRWLLLAGALFALLGGAQLFVLGDRSAHWFAWTLTAPQDAGFLGAFSWAAAGTLLLAFSEHSWGGVRALVPGAFTFAALALAATVSRLGSLHAFNLSTPGLVALAWLLSVAAATLVWLLLMYVNERRFEEDPHPGRRPSLLAVGLVVVLGAVALVAGIQLYIAPESGPWPWPVGGLTGQVMGAWLVSAAMVGLALLVERAYARSRPAFAGAALLGALLLLALVRYPPHLVHPARLLAYVGLALATLVFGFLGLRRGLSDPRPRAAPFVR